MSIASNETGVLKDLRVLLVEDELLIALGVSGTLKDAGASQIDIAATLKDANARAKDKAYDAAILDVRMPDGLSFDLGRDLLDAGTAVVFHSGHALQADFDEFPEAQFCAKPASPKSLTDALVAASGRRPET